MVKDFNLLWLAHFMVVILNIYILDTFIWDGLDRGSMFMEQLDHLGVQQYQ